MSMTIDDSLVSETVGVNAGREEKQQEQREELDCASLAAALYVVYNGTCTLIKYDLDL